MNKSENKKSKVEYKKAFEKVRSIINQYDPSQLEPGRLDSRTPVDEYDTEVARIVAYYVRHEKEVKLKPELLVMEINRIWQEYFKENCRDAERIVREIVAST